MLKKTISMFLVILLALSCLAMASAQTGIDIVEVEGGKVQGVATDVASVQLFKGIPFAASTAGENRFRAPQPVEPWDGVKVCDTWGDAAIQQPNCNPVGTFWGDEFYFDPEFDPPISEDCLNLNLYTPAVSSGDKLPVLVYFHGGGNDHGNASEMEFYASKLAAKGIIVISAQYRLNCFGFLAHPDLSAEDPNGVSGNYTYLDMIQALKWVKNNVAGFGGDPDTVTISGQSAGSMNVNALLKSPLAKGLFNRAILQSGFNMLINRENVVSDSSKLAAKEAAGKAAVDALADDQYGGKYDTDGDGEISLDELRAIDAQELRVLVKGSGQTVDGYVFTEESMNFMSSGALDGIDLIIGSNSDEMTSLMGNPNGTMDVEKFYTQQKNSLGELFDKYNFRELYPVNDPTDAYRLNVRLSSDSLLETNRITAEYFNANNTNCRAYTYYFNHTLPGRNEDFYGSFHSAELWYVFNSLRDVDGQRDWTDKDYQMADIISSYWANFVRTGDPNAAGLPEWTTSDSNHPGFMWFRDGQAGMATTQYDPAFAARNALYREQVMQNYKITDAELTMPPEPEKPTEEPTTEVQTTAPATTAKVPAKTGDETNPVGMLLVTLLFGGLCCCMVLIRRKHTVQ